MTTLIKDRAEFEKFVQDVLPPLKPGEVYFVSLSARNKYLTPEERVYYGLGRTEMFGRTLVRSSNGWDYAMEKLYATLGYRRTKTGLFVPGKCLVVYVNINPSSMLDAYSMFTETMNNQFAEAAKAWSRGKSPNLDGFERMDRTLMNCVQKSPSRRVWLDVDMDTTDDKAVDELIGRLLETDVKCSVVRTHGGWHVLVDRASLGDSNAPLHAWVKELDGNLDEGEVIFNNNAMVPMPGTLQAGKLVTVTTFQ